jgi:hypothetical protein
MSRVLASAIVDKIDDGSVPIWEVQVWGQPPFDHRRTYTLQVKTDNLAAQEGIRLFVEEMENLDDFGSKES